MRFHMCVIKDMSRGDDRVHFQHGLGVEMIKPRPPKRKSQNKKERRGSNKQVNLKMIQKKDSDMKQSTCPCPC